MTFSQLRALLAVVDTGSVHGAAEQLVISQPAVSGAVAALQRELGVELLERHGRGVRVTSAGRAFADEARAGLQHLDRAVRVARSVEDPARGSVQIAAIATAAEHLVLPLLAAFRREHADAEVTVSVGNRTTVWAALADLAADLVVAGRPPSSLDAMVLGTAENTLVFVGLPAWSIRSRTEIITHLAGTTWLLREDGSGTRDATDELLAKLDLDPPRMILGSNGAVREAILANFGVGVLPLASLQPRLDLRELAIIDCPGTPVDRPWHLVSGPQAALSPTAALAARSLLRAPNGFMPSAAGRRLLRPATR